MLRGPHSPSASSVAALFTEGNGNWGRDSQTRAQLLGTLRVCSVSVNREGGESATWKGQLAPRARVETSMSAAQS